MKKQEAKMVSLSNNKQDIFKELEQAVIFLTYFCGIAATL